MEGNGVSCALSPPKSHNRRQLLLAVMSNPGEGLLLAFECAAAHGCRRSADVDCVMVEVAVECGSCGKPIRGGDEFCEACGARVSDELKSALRARLEASHTGYAEHTKKLRGAQTTIAALAVLFVIGGVIFFFITRGQLDEARAMLSDRSDSEMLLEPTLGAATVGELKAAIEREPWKVLGLNLFLAAVMLGLWIWSKRAVLPAIISALGIYVTVIVASALHDPTTLASGIFIKIIVITALAKGVQSTLAARKLEIAR